ncbi:hypothetical protein V8F33_011510 [Rhypophila sp. PSN 637]
MHDNRTHPLLEQVPLTVSPFVKLPTATTLPYTYKPMPNSLPPSHLGLTATASPMDPSSSSSGADQPKPKYVVSSSGHAAHPDDIVASCRALQAHITKLQADAEEQIRKIDERIKARELAEKRRLAPGWLDSDARLLEPERKSVPVSEAPSDPVGPGYGGSGQSRQGQHQGGGYGHHYHDGPGSGMVSEMAVPDEGEQLDRAFGALELGQGKPQGQDQSQGLRQW